MAVDKNLFMHNLAVVSMMKDETPYVKEWLDYHILAGVDHFYIYDHESREDFKDVLLPYIYEGIVTYKVYPDEKRLIDAYTDAFKNYRFFCRYMAFIDADEFIFPQNNKSITEVVDKILAGKPNVSGIGISWKFYGSNNLEKADYSKGVLERFTKRAENINEGVKSVANPRRIDFMVTPHYCSYFEGFNDIISNSTDSVKKIYDKIIINHYHWKSREEYAKKASRSDSSYNQPDWYKMKNFSHDKDNDVFDDSILKYRDFRKNFVFQPPQIDYERLATSLIQNLAPMLNENVPLKFLEGKMETFLTCRALSTYLKEDILGYERGELVEKLSLKAIHSTMLTKVSIGDAQMLFSELPNILKLDYPEVELIRQDCIEMIPKIQSNIRKNIVGTSTMMLWRDLADFEKLLEMLKTFDNYEHRKD